MGGQVKISVIMGVYNPEKKQLRKAVESLITQTMQEWELLLYDDGSDADYIELIYEVSGIDKRIIYIRNEKNHGLAYALNQCMKRTKGKYIARMDDDDESRPDRFRRQYEFLESNADYGWVGSNAELFDGETVWGCQRMPEIPEEKDFLKFSPYIHPSVMFRREVLLKSHGYIPAKVTRRCEDYELFMRLHIKGLRGYNIQDNLLRYREDEEAYRRRLFKYRVNEMVLRYRGFRRMGILRPSTVSYVLRPLAGAVVPVSFLRFVLRRKKTADRGIRKDGKHE